MGKLADELEAEALELVLLDEFVKVHGEELEGDADVVSKDEAVQHVDDVVGIVFVLLL